MKLRSSMKRRLSASNVKPPIPSSMPGSSRSSNRRAPSMRVPFALPRSRTIQPDATRSTRACSREA